MPDNVHSRETPDGDFGLYPADMFLDQASQGYTQKLWEWSLVLWAMGIPHDLRPKGFGWELCVSREHITQAQRHIVLYEQENSPKPQVLRSPSQAGSAESVFWVLLALALWQAVAQQQVQALGLDALNWVELGRVDGRAMLDRQQWWRALTALTLHSGPEHLVSNLVFGGLFMHLVCRELGGGVAWLLTVAGAGVANGINVLVQGPGHLALGASTAVFAALGLLSGLPPAREMKWPAVLAPLGAGLALLAWLGSGGERTDVGAHVFGFGVGLAFSLGLRKAGAWNASKLRRLPQRMFGLAALGLMVSAWILAVVL